MPFKISITCLQICPITSKSARIYAPESKEATLFLHPVHSDGLTDSQPACPPQTATKSTGAKHALGSSSILPYRQKS